MPEGDTKNTQNFSCEKGSQMDRWIKRELDNIIDFAGLVKFERSATRENFITTELAEAIKARSEALGRQLLIERTGLDLSILTPAEERIVDAVIEYIILLKRQRKYPGRTLQGLRKHGLIEAVEITIKRAKQGYQTLRDVNRRDISYEQIVLDYPEEFSSRAAWRAGRTLGRPNTSRRSPAPVDTREHLAAREEQCLNESIEVKIRVSKSIERGPIGARVKKETGYKCQLYDVMGRDPFGFRKKNGDPYIEAHHIMPVSTQQVGVLAASNIMTLCANHHRQMHYGEVTGVLSPRNFKITIEGKVLNVPKTKFFVRKSPQSHLPKVEDLFSFPLAGLLSPETLTTRRPFGQPFQRAARRRRAGGEHRLQQVAAGRGFPIQHFSGDERAGPRLQHEAIVDL